MENKLEIEILSIDWDAIRQEVMEKPEIKRLQEEVDSLKVVKGIFEGTIKAL